MRPALLALVLVSTLAPARARAGECDESFARQQVVELETFAAGKGAQPDIWGLCIDQEIRGNAKLTGRFTAACEQITTKDPSNASCVRWSVELGAKKLGSLDLFDAINKLFGIDPWKPGDIAMPLFEKLDDARALPVIKPAWTAANASKKPRSAKADDQYRWSIWRHAAIRLFASQGRGDDISFLQEQAKLTRDSSVKRAIARAIKAIEKRAATP